jgi:hypothetical protein
MYTVKLWELSKCDDEFLDDHMAVFTTSEKAKDYAEKWLALFHPDCIVNWDTDEGLDGYIHASFDEFDIWIMHNEVVDPNWDDHYKSKKESVAQNNITTR